MTTGDIKHKKTIGEKLKPHLGEKDPDGLQVSMAGRLRNYLLAGILVSAPLGITIYLVWMFLLFMDGTVAELIPQKYNPNHYLPFSVPGFGLLIALLFFICVGWLARNFLGRMIIGIYEYFMNRMPVVRHIYGAIKQIAETIMASQSQAFREVVMLEYPRKGVWSIGFVTNRSEGEIQRVTKEEMINVFVPTTPNPTSGYLLFVPKKELHYLHMSVEEGVKLVVSAGIIVPPDHGMEKYHHVTDDSDTL
ncbi:MAG: DUF502 domain-containing protein [Rhodospirillales bacterium]|nr:DUF502 domain-containing protein [Rhodospirillales bacterium]MCB9965600.1 DUF502 domain-containing protein [Rhodospirillales bacterium]MCB9979840.1 DUF502 domain-containing protein [Rhodospirillales bacterium]